MSAVLDVIKTKVVAAIAPDHLEVLDESHNHSRGVDTHFRVVVVSERFDGLRLAQRHQLIYQALAAELQQGVHALAIHTLTPAEWQQNGQTVAASPACRGGSKVDFS